MKIKNILGVAGKGLVLCTAIAGVYGMFRTTREKDDVVVLKRYKKYYELTSEWLLQALTDKDSIKEYLEQNNYKNIAVYGMGSVAELLSKQIKRYKDREIKYYIDRNGKELYYGLDGVKVIDIDAMDTMTDIDVIIITAIANYDEIMAEIKDRTNNVKIVSLDEIVINN